MVYLSIIHRKNTEVITLFSYTNSSPNTILEMQHIMFVTILQFIALEEVRISKTYAKTMSKIHEHIKNIYYQEHTLQGQLLIYEKTIP